MKIYTESKLTEFGAPSYEGSIDLQDAIRMIQTKTLAEIFADGGGVTSTIKGAGNFKARVAGKSLICQSQDDAFVLDTGEVTHTRLVPDGDSPVIILTTKRGVAVSFYLS